ncbi:hypothetical protein LTR36_002611 [Oleoguttula mirabilis]|uniref:C2H2-type domain-containing protein n=1 Tax=Oleoguttula mirabilis TaxID=1507867 RepID=A0AAV9JKY9_9PEZI|nr:hypothetical protein LTR36_002611 [Oleoguttula mirabilis]
MDGGYEAYARSPPPLTRVPTRDREEYRPADPYRDRRRSPGGLDIRSRARAVNADHHVEPRRRDRDRRRSRSPAQIDRYQPDRLPRDDYYRRDDVHRERRRSSPQPPTIDRYVPGQNDLPPQLLVNPMADPMKLEFQVGFTWFAEWWRAEQRVKEEKERQRTGKPALRLRGERESREERETERPKIQAAYDQYKENLQKTQAQTFVRLHKGEDWFRERYVPEVRDPFRRKLMDYRKGLFARWEADLTAGAFDEFTLEGIYKSESNGLGGVLEKEEGETTAAAEVLGVGDLLPSRGGDLRDPVSAEPTLLIKTIAPTVSREKFEAFAKEHLGEGDGGYKHLSLSDPNPLKKCHRMGWIMLNPESEQLMEEQPTGETGEEGEADGEVVTSSARAAGMSTSEKALANINTKTIEDPERGNFTVHCGVHRPPDAPRKKALWDLFSAPERIARDLDLATRLVRRLDHELGDEYFGGAKIEQRVQDLAEQGALQAPQASSKPPKDTDMDADGPEEGEEDEGMIEDEDETDDEELLIKKKKLDLLVEYLRRVYNFCFFCVFESDSVHELQRKCPGGHLRRPRASLTSVAKEVAKASAQGEEFPLRKNGTSKQDSRGEGEDADVGIMDAESPVEERKVAAMKPSARNAQQLQRAFNWVKTFEEKVLQILEPEKVNVRKIGGVPVEEGAEEELIKFVKQEDANKFRCKVPECTKLFKGTDFWRKHVEKRHPEFYANVVDTVQLVNTYVLDPSHIAPSRSDANSNGHFPLNNHAGPTGTPRGFQLSTQFQGMGFQPGMGTVGNGGLQMFPTPQMAMGMTPGFAGPMTMGYPTGVGPMRTMGRGSFAMNGSGPGRMPGPYARNDGRGPRGPPMGGLGRGPMVGAGGGGALEGGAGAMGPREAVAGRQLRSYEDLDADKGEGTGELNY